MNSWLRGAAMALALAASALTAACGGVSSGGTSSSSVSGVATPSSVSVVSANNAN